MARARSPWPPNDITNATRSRIDSRPAATIDRPPAKLMPRTPILPSVLNCGCSLVHFTASSITSVTCGVTLKCCRSGAATVSTPNPVAARSSASPTSRDSLMPSRCTPGISRIVRRVCRAGPIEAAGHVAAAGRHGDIRIARDRCRAPGRERRRGPGQIGGANDEAESVEIGKREERRRTTRMRETRSPLCRGGSEARDGWYTERL